MKINHNHTTKVDKKKMQNSTENCIVFWRKKLYIKN